MKLLTRATRLTLIALMTISGVLISAQTAVPAPKKDSITISLKMDRVEVSIGQSPWAILSVSNLTEDQIVVHNYMYRVYVQGDKGEPPTTQVQRQMTGRLKPGEPDLGADEWALWTIAPGDSDLRKFRLAYLYDLSAPGKYTAYAEVMDPSSMTWLRTNTVQFKMQVATQ